MMGRVCVGNWEAEAIAHVSKEVSTGHPVKGFTLGVSAFRSAQGTGNGGLGPAWVVELCCSEAHPKPFLVSPTARRSRLHSNADPVSDPCSRTDRQTEA